MLTVNPNIVTGNLLYYYDFNNKKCYSWDGSLTCNSLINYKDILSAFNSSIFVIDRGKRFINSSNQNKLGSEFNEIDLYSFTIQFWVQLEDTFEYNNVFNRLLGTQGLSSISTTFELIFNGDPITFNNDQLYYNLFTEFPLEQEPLETLTIFVNITGGLGFYNSNFSPSSANSQFSLSGNKWNSITIIKTEDSIKLYKNLDEEIYIYSQPLFFNVKTKLSGLQTFLNAYKINHICIYDRDLSFAEILNNYKSFASMYKGGEEQTFYADPTPSSSKIFFL